MPPFFITMDQCEAAAVLRRDNNSRLLVMLIRKKNENFVEKVLHSRSGCGKLTFCRFGREDKLRKLLKSFLKK
jgi:hypothetical protein